MLNPFKRFILTPRVSNFIWRYAFCATDPGDPKILVISYFKAEKLRRYNCYEIVGSEKNISGKQETNFG